MKSSLAAYRFGRTWEERWALHPRVVAESLGPPGEPFDGDEVGAVGDDGTIERGGRRGHLHLV
jgi:hypothetical protein